MSHCLFPSKTSLKKKSLSFERVSIFVQPVSEKYVLVIRTCIQLCKKEMYFHPMHYLCLHTLYDFRRLV